MIDRYLREKVKMRCRFPISGTETHVSGVIQKIRPLYAVSIAVCMHT